MFSSRSVQIAAIFLDLFGKALPNLCRSFYNETKAEMFFSVFAVALLAEGVDRNTVDQCKVAQPVKVALLAEGVDRNLPVRISCRKSGRSPSSRRAWIEIISGTRRAWIEITLPQRSRRTRSVALLAEGVDRNCYAARKVRGYKMSPSSRRAWIEIPYTFFLPFALGGSPSSRRAWIEIGC